VNKEKNNFLEVLSDDRSLNSSCSDYQKKDSEVNSNPFTLKPLDSGKKATLNRSGRKKRKIGRLNDVIDEIVQDDSHKFKYLVNESKLN